MCLPTRLVKTTYSPSATIDGAIGLPTPVLMRIPWKYYSLYGGMWNLFCRAEHYPCVQNLLWSIRRGNPPCNAEDDLRAGLIVIEAWFSGY